jgi:hypothetical protein
MMFKEDWYEGLRSYSGFAQDRGSYFHSGVDYNSPLYKKYGLGNLFQGVVAELKTDEIKGGEQGKFFGRVVTIKTDPAFEGGAKDPFFTSYCHCHIIDSKILKEWELGNRLHLIKPGYEVGKMGNTGHCMIMENGVWRDITPQEQADPKFVGGTHLHLMTWQWAGKNVKTKLLKDLIKKKITKDSREGTDYFWQWNRLFFRPQVLMEYFIYLQDK